jgi:hypothetical protein
MPFVKKEIIKMTKIYSIALSTFILFLIFTQSLLGLEKIFMKKNDLLVELTFSYFSTGSFYDKEGNQVSWRNDPEREENADYTFELTSLTVQPYIEYKFTDEVSAHIRIPLTRSKLIESYINDSDVSGAREERSNYALFQPDHYAIGGKYILSIDEIYPFFKAEFRIPPGFHKGILNDPDYNFLSDGAFEFLATIGGSFRFDKTWIETDITYNYRDEELVDQIIFDLEAGLMTVPNTALGVYGRYYQSLGIMDDAPDFDPRMTIIQQDLLKVGALFDIYFDNFYSRFEYSVNLYGKNTYTGGIFYLRAGIIL